jgi:hypothetical protein
MRMLRKTENENLHSICAEKTTFSKELVSAVSLQFPVTAQNLVTMSSYNGNTVSFNLQINLRTSGKGKSIPVEAMICPGGSRRFRLPDFKTISI